VITPYISISISISIISISIISIFLTLLIVIIMVELKPDDYIGISFWLISVALFATTVFLVIERESVKEKWKTPTTVAAMVTGIATVHYYYMRHVWVTTQTSPIVYRYIDWFLTVPLQIIEFYLILSVASKIPVTIFYQLLGSSIIMILSGFLGESGIINRMIGFIIGTIAWFYIVYQITIGEASKFKDETKDESVKIAFNSLKYIVTIGWAIYPIGYLLKEKNMNLLYNLGDLVNKILFALIIWYAGKSPLLEKLKNILNK
jgi:bacteriorhodopsin